METIAVLKVILYYYFVQNRAECVLNYPTWVLNEADSPLVSCARNITHQYVPFVPVSFFEEDVQNNVIAQKLLNTLNLPCLLQSLQVTYSYETTYILFHSDAVVYQRLLSKINYGSKPRFLIVWQKNNSAVLREAIVDVLSVFWKFRYLSVLVLSEQPDDTVDIYTYFPYSPAHCGQVGPPVLMDTWNATERSFRVKRDLFTFGLKLGNLHGCPIRCWGKNRPPDSIIIPLGQDKYLLSGSGGHALTVIEQKLNFTAAIHMPGNFSTIDEFGYYLTNDTPQVVREKLLFDMQNIGFGTFSHIIYFMPDIEFSTYYSNECFMWFAPCWAGKAPSKWQIYYKEFSPFIWFLIIITFVVVLVMLTSMSKLLPQGNSGFKCLQKNVFNIIAFMLENSVPLNLKSISIRYFLVQFLLYSMIVSVAYKASLKSFLTVPWQVRNIETTDELAKANFKVTGPPQMFNILKRFSGNNVCWQKMIDRFTVKIDGKFSEVVNRVTHDRDTTTFGAQRFMFHYSKYRDNATTTDPMCPVPGCVIRAATSPFLVRRGSPFLDSMNRITSSLVESGIISMWWTRHEPKNPKPNKDFELALYTFHHLEGSLWLLTLGLSTATIFFCIELLQYHVSKQYCERARKHEIIISYLE